MRISGAPPSGSSWTPLPSSTLATSNAPTATKAVWETRESVLDRPSTGRIKCHRKTYHAP